MNYIIKTFLSLVLCLPIAVSADLSRNNFKLLDGFSWSCHDEQLNEILSASLASSIILIDCALSSVDLEKWNNGEEIEMAEYYSVATTAEKYGKYNKEDLFKSLKKEFEGQVNLLALENNELLDQYAQGVSEKLTDVTGNTVVLNDIEMVSLGVLFDKKNIYSYALLVNTLMETEESKGRYSQVAFVSVLRKKDDLVFHYYYRDFEDQSDIDLAKVAVTNWIASNIE